jgi:hypothetical protein
MKNIIQYTRFPGRYSNRAPLECKCRSTESLSKEEWLVSRSSSFTSGNRALRTHWTPRLGLDTVEKVYDSLHLSRIEPRSTHQYSDPWEPRSISRHRCVFTPVNCGRELRSLYSVSIMTSLLHWPERLTATLRCAVLSILKQRLCWYPNSTSYCLLHMQPSATLM